ncbi:MAG: type IV pilus assembly protein PilM [Phycisphaerales bacterium]|nr:type IV pilus assembly protein PilM [Phycisphaerales bacterium]
MASSNACWGIEIGAGAVKAIKIVLDGDNATVADFAYIPHSRVLSTPDIDPDDAKRVALGRLVSEYDLSKATVAVSVPGHSAFARFAKLPPVEPKKVPDIVKFEAVQQIPFPLEDVEWDYQTFRSPDSPDVEVGIFAITKQRIAAELAILHDVNLTPDVVTLSPVAAYNAIAYDLQFTETSPGTILLDVGTTSTDLIIAHAGRVWVRTFPIGGHEFTNALVEQFKLSYPKAEKLKREAESSQHARHVFQALRPVFSDLVQDVQRSIGYYQSMHKGANLERLVGMGSTFHLPGLRKYLKQQLGMNVYRVEQFKKLQIEGPRAAEFESLSLNFVTAYGLAMQGLGMAALNANLMPVAVSKQAMWAAKGKWFAAAAGLALAATGAMFIRPFIDQQALNTAPPTEITEAVSLNSRLASEARDAGVTDDVSEGAHIAELMSLYQGREIYLRLLGDVNAILTSADAKAAAREGGAGFKLQAVYTDYLYGDVPLPTVGASGNSGASGSRLGGRSGGGNAEIPSMRGRDLSGFEGGEGRFGREMPSPEGAGLDTEGEATGPTGPRVAVTLDLSTTQAFVTPFVDETIKQWLIKNAQREGMPYYYTVKDIKDLHFEVLNTVEHKKEVVDAQANNPGYARNSERGIGGGRIGGGRYGNPEGGQEREIVLGGGPESGGRGSFQQPGNQQLPADAAAALAQLEQLAPVAPPPEADPFPDGAIETFIRVTFVAVLGQPASESNEEGDQ